MENELKELSIKIDIILELQELILNKLNHGVIFSKEVISTNSGDRKLKKKDEQNLRFEKIKEELHLRLHYGLIFKRQFNLVLQPSIERIKIYLKNHDASAFDGLKRNK